MCQPYIENITHFQIIISLYQSRFCDYLRYDNHSEDIVDFKSTTSCRSISKYIESSDSQLVEKAVKICTEWMRNHPPTPYTECYCKVSFLSIYVWQLLHADDHWEVILDLTSADPCMCISK